MDLIVSIVQGAVAVIAIASIVCSLTPTPKDDVLIGKLYKIIETLALRYENIEQRLAAGAKRFDKLETMLWAVYPFIVGTVLLAKYVG